MRYGIWLLAACAWSASDADRAVVQQMRNQGTGVPRYRVIHRGLIDPELDLVVVGYSGSQQPFTGEGGWWDGKTKLGIFLQRRDKPGLLYKIAIENGLGDGDCYARVERATATDVVISCTPEKGRSGPNRKFVYDLRAKALIKRVDYAPFAMQRVFVSGGKAVLIGSDLRRLIAIEYDPGREPTFRLLTGGKLSVGQAARHLQPAPSAPERSWATRFISNEGIQTSRLRTGKPLHFVGEQSACAGANWRKGEAVPTT